MPIFGKKVAATVTREAALMAPDITELYVTIQD